jgi:RHS repeat-associated protein
MRLSIMAGWLYSVVRMVRGEAESHTKCHANRGVARDLDCVESNVQTLAPVCRYSQNAVKMHVDSGVLISSRMNWVLRAWQIVTTRHLQKAMLHLFACLILMAPFTTDAIAAAFPGYCIQSGSSGAVAHCVEGQIKVESYFWLNDGGPGFPTPREAYIWYLDQANLSPGTDYRPKPGECGNDSISLFSWNNNGIQEGYMHAAPCLFDQYTSGVFWRDLSGWSRARATCPIGWDLLQTETMGSRGLPGVCALRITPKSLGEPCTACGNPINIATGNKYQREVDFAPPSTSMLLSIARHYNSLGTLSTISLGNKWHLGYDRRVIVNGVGSGFFSVIRDNGRIYEFKDTAAGFVTDADISDRLTKLTDASGATTGWKYFVAKNDDIEMYAADGKLSSITSRAGVTQTLVYSNASTPLSVAPAPGLLLTVTDSFNHQLSFSYDATSRITSITDPNGKIYSYAYDTAGNLAAVTYPDLKVRTYKYDEATLVPATSPLSALTGIIDENGTRYATFSYANGASAVSTEHNGGVEKYQMSTVGGATNLISVTDPLGTAKTYDFVSILRAPKLANLTQPCSNPGCTGTVTQSRTYDANSNIATLKDFNGTTTSYRYDLTRNLELSRTEGIPATLTGSCPNGGVYYANNYASSCDSGTCWVTSGSFPGSQDATPLGYPGQQYACAVPLANSLIRKITTTWNASYRLPATITEPVTGGSKTTTHTYDTNGNLTQRVVTTPQSTRTWLWSGYDAYGRATTMTDPRGKITTYAYYPNTAAQNTTLANSRGMLASITNAVGHVNTITAYNAHGQPLAMTDANGLVTTMTYDARMRLKSRTVSGTGINETTSYDYDGVGQLIKVTLPDATFITYTYDGAHRLTQIQDSQANKIVYTLDAMGNRTAEQAYDPAGLLARSRTRVYDALNRLKQDIGATTPATQISQYGYDNQGNSTTTTDPLSRVTTNAFDALNRLVQVTDPNTPTAGITKYDYDVQDNLTKVVDPKFSPQGTSAPATTYTYNGFNELISQTSPDTGITSYTYDAAGNMTQKTDARDKVAKYVYDNVNRVTQIKHYPTTANANANTSADETVTYTYDTSCGNATSSKGRLCTLSDKSGTTTYSYDLLGRITAKSQNVSSLTQAHSYRYNAAGQMDQLTTASGQVIGYGYTNNRVTSISVNGVALIGSITYDPFGPAVAWLWPSATTPALKTYRDYDLDGRMIRWELKNGVSYIQRDVVWDNASRVTNLKDLLTPAQANNQGFGYDALDRLTTTKLGTSTTASQILAYDAIGNRTSATINGIIATYNLPTNSHKLTSTTGGTNPRAFTYDAMGNLTFDGKYTNTYLNNGRLNKVVWTVGTTTNTATYDLNALGQRVRKVTPSSVVGTRRFMYDEAGRLAGEYDAAGKLVQETIWLGDVPVATLRPKSGSTTTPIAVDVFYVHADHLGTPRVITRPSDNKIVWKWDSAEAFGNSLPNENPSALGNFKYNLRMPGQVWDQETGTFYNYFRDYDPSLGRYVQSDPIGLRGGINTFAYVKGSPLRFVDPRGLLPFDEPAGGGGASPPSNPYGVMKTEPCYQRVMNESMFAVQQQGLGAVVDNSPMNAVLHCYGVCRLQKECGSLYRIVVAYGHETVSRNGESNTPYSAFGHHIPIISYPGGTINDLKNNGVGVACANGIGNCADDGRKDCMSCCMSKFRGGGLSHGPVTGGY